MIRKNVCLLFWTLGVFCMASAHAGIGIIHGKNCKVNTAGTNEFWFCGELENETCDDGRNHRKTRNLHYNKGTVHKYTQDGKMQHFLDANYYCCAKNGYDENGNPVTKYSGKGNGQFIPANGWTDHTNQVTKTFPGGGKCTWTQKINVCGMVDNPEDENVFCSKPNDCDIGLVLRNDVCIALCDESANMAFASKTSNTCISCEPTKTQGIVDHTCIKCDERTDVFDIEKNGCVKKTSKILAQTTFFDKCWLCYTPEDLRKCLKNVSNGVAVPEQCKMGYNPDALNSK